MKQSQITPVRGMELEARKFVLFSDQDVTTVGYRGGYSNLIGWTGSQGVVRRDYAEMEKVKRIIQTFYLI